MLNQKDLKKYCTIEKTGYNEYKITSNRRHIDIHYFPLTRKHPKGTDMTYYGINYWEYELQTPKYTTLQRFLWTYFNGDIPEGMQVDHINSNPLDNDLTNLQLLTQQENLKKKNKHANQYGEFTPKKKNV